MDVDEFAVTRNEGILMNMSSSGADVSQTTGSGAVLDSDRFRILMRAFGSSVVVLTVTSGSQDHGVTVTAICSVTAEPPRILVVINKSNRSHAIIAGAGRFVVNILAEHQSELGQRFSSKHSSPFDGVTFSRSSSGAAVFSGSVGYLDCRTVREIDVGTHTIFVADVVDGDAGVAGPLLYHAGSYKSLIGRMPDHGIADVFTSRWSPRSFGDVAITDEELMTFMEAARWAPSAMNVQPWRFIVVKRNDENWPAVLDVLSTTNKSWAGGAAALIAVISKTTMTFAGRSHDAPTHQFDAGAAWMSFALQARLADWHTHAMAGFDRERANAVLLVPADHWLNAIVAIGKQGKAAALPENLRDREAPSTRRPIVELVSRNAFVAPLNDD